MVEDKGRGEGGAAAERLNGAVRGYVNDLSVDFSLAEFTLDFLQVFGGGAPAQQCRLVTSPANMPAFRDALSAAIADYERKYGALGGGG